MHYEEFLPEHRTSDRPTDDWWQWRGNHIHIVRRRDADAPVRVVIVHGAGGNAAALFPVASSVAQNADLAAVDLPLYGDTVIAEPKKARYGDWIEILVDFLADEDDGRPVILFGASMGGLLAVEVANNSESVSHVMATCLLDPTDPAARRAMMRSKFLANHGRKFLRIAAGPFRSCRVLVNRIAPVDRMSRNVDLTNRLANDPKAGGVRVPLGFLRSFLEYPAVETSVPVTLVHPARDDWTPLQLSERVLARFTGPTETHLLEECGHFPVEEPGLTTLERITQATIDRLT